MFDIFQKSSLCILQFILIGLGGACTADDQKLADRDNGKAILNWFEGCAGVNCRGQCAADCMKQHGFSDQCLPCFKTGTDCIVSKCWYPCSDLDPLNWFGTCRGCAQKKCMPDFITCSGLSFPLSTSFIEKLREDIRNSPQYSKSAGLPPRH